MAWSSHPMRGSTGPGDCEATWCATAPAGGQNGGASRAGVMDHQYIEGHNIPDRYLQGTLSATERTRFEEHFIDCAECLDRLEMTEDFRGALRTVAAEGAATSRVYARPGLRAWLMGMSGGRHAALLAAAVLLLVALPSVLLIVWTGQSRRQVDQARLSAADWQRKYEESQQAGRKAEAEMQAREQEVARQRLEIETQRERERQTRVAEEGSRQALLQTAPIFDLNTVRGGTRTVCARNPDLHSTLSAVDCAEAGDRARSGAPVVSRHGLHVRPAGHLPRERRDRCQRGARSQL